jgi:hypothetical protein
MVVFGSLAALVVVGDGIMNAAVVMVVTVGDVAAAHAG